jgi:hypothetical protein
MTDWRAASAAILLAPALRRAVQVAENSSGPAFEDLPYDQRDLWVLLAEAVLESLREQFIPRDQLADDDTFFRETAEMTRKHFQTIKGGKA